MSGRPILVTGAGGFIGGRVVEVLHALGRGPVRAGVRRWASAAQVGRLPVDIVLCDILDPSTLDVAMAGAHAVVHCAVGDRRATVEGTRNVLAAAQRLGVERVVHLSTIDVYGRASGVQSEAQPLLHTGAAYGDSKIDAETVCREVQRSGLPVTILRPTIVYGPGSASWTVEFAERLLKGDWLLAPEDTGGTCNLVYVDDVVAAVLRALERQEPLNGAYNVNGPDTMTWLEYFHALNDAMGLPPLVPASRARSHLIARVMSPVRQTAKWALRRFPNLIMGLYQRSELAKLVMKRAEGAIRQSPTAGEFKLYSLQAQYPTDLARRELGFHPAFSAALGIELSVQWLRESGYLSREPVTRARDA